LGNKDLQAPGSQSPEDGVASASYQCPAGGAAGMTPLGTPVGVPTSMPMNAMAGVSGPQYGMPITGTPIGLPGPPHVPLGVPAGLRQHVVQNHTCVHLPKPTEKVEINVKETPGYSYPKPADHARIVERTSAGVGWFHQPLCDRHEQVKPNCEEAAPCPAE
jgi:hypothetical protein